MSYSKEEHLQLKQAFWDKYSTEDLKSSFEKHLERFFLEQEQYLQAQGVPAEYSDWVISRKNLLKKELASLAGIAFLNQDFFQKFRAILDKEVQQVLDIIIWEESLSQEDILDRLGIEISTVEERRYSASYAVSYHRLKPVFSFFKQKVDQDKTAGTKDKASKYALYLPPFLRKQLASISDLPKEAIIEAKDEVEPTEYIFHGEQAIFLELQRILVYHQQDQIKASKRGKVQASTLGKMQRKLQLKEFYAEEKKDKVLKTLRTNLIASLMVKSYLKRNILEPEEILKRLILNNYTAAYESSLALMMHLQGVGSIGEYNVNQKVERELLGVLDYFPPGQWISMEDVLSIIKYNFINVQLVDKVVAKGSLYYEIRQAFSNGKGYNNRQFVDDALYENAITKPLLKGTLFLFAAFGLLDIAYDRPDLEELGTTAFSHFDGLRFVRLNNLGAYLTRKAESYTPTASQKKGKIKLSEDSLTIITDKNDPTAAIVLEPYAHKVTANRFRTDASIFLKSCRNKKDLQAKIALFQESTTKDLPENWQAFFKDLENKIDPLIPIEDVYVFKLPENNRALIQLIAKDEFLREIVQKAEGYQILVTQENLAKFKQRLQEFGYLLSE